MKSSSVQPQSKSNVEKKKLSFNPNREPIRIKPSPAAAIFGCSELTAGRKQRRICSWLMRRPQASRRSSAAKDEGSSDDYVRGTLLPKQQTKNFSESSFFWKAFLLLSLPQAKHQHIARVLLFRLYNPQFCGKANNEHARMTGKVLSESVPVHLSPARGFRLDD